MTTRRLALAAALALVIALFAGGFAAAQAAPPPAAPTTPQGAQGVTGAQGALPAAGGAAAGGAPAETEALTVRLADLAYIQGVRDNQLVGVGLVTGLAGRGDTSNSVILQKAVANLASAFGIQVTQSDIRSRNCAVVTVTATLPPFARPGDPIPVTVSSIGDATDLRGGILLQTNLRAANGQVYAVAQGSVASTDNTSVRTVGEVPDGAIVERGVDTSFVNAGKVAIILRNPDFITAAATAAAIRKAYPAAQVTAVDGAEVDVAVPPDRSADPVGFIASLEQLTLTPDMSGKVVVNPRTGVVVVGQNVRIGKVAVSYKNARITIGSTDIESPYYGLNQGKNPFVINNTATVNDLVEVLQDAGVSGDTIIEILKAIDRAGALYGKLIVM